MVKRRGYYVADSTIKCCDVEIEWNLGFDKEAKIVYIERVYDELKKQGFKTPLDVTSANKTRQNGYILSPLYLKLNNRVVEDIYKEAADKLDKQALLLYSNLLIGLALKYREKEQNLLFYSDIYVDVFATPTKAETSQSKAYAVWRLLFENNDLWMYDKPEAFFEWYSKCVPKL